MSNSPTITIPKVTPFSHQVGINYDAWSTNWYPSQSSNAAKETIVKEQIDQVLPAFRMIHLYRLCGWPKVIENNALDPVTESVLTAAVASTKSGKPVEISLGTEVGIIPLMANGDGEGSGSAYCEAWVSALTAFFNDSALLKKTIKVITLGNELDSTTISNSDLGNAMINLYAALTKGSNDFEEIPITISLANMSLTNKWGTFPNAKSNGFMATVISNWKKTWNKNHPFLFGNHYPKWVYDPSGGENGLDGYIAAVQAYNTNPPSDKDSHGPYEIEVFIGETGFSAEGDQETEEAEYINDLFDWLHAQVTKSGNCIPTFIFESFDEPKKDAGQKAMGIYACDNSTGKPAGVKSKISIPSWIA